MMWSQYASVALGGVLGAWVRFSLSVLFPLVPGQWPVASFITNVSGCLIMGCVYYGISHAHIPAGLKPLLMAGFLGAMTTFSSFALEAWLLLTHNAHLLALAYLLASVIACVLAIALGYALAGWSAKTLA